MSSEEFNEIIGYIEDIVISSEFQKIQTDFFDEHCMEFDDEEENKLNYMDIFNEYITLIEEFIMKHLQEIQRDNVNIDTFLSELSATATRLDGEIYEFLYSLSDFTTFKRLILNYKEFKLNEGRSVVAD